MEIVSEKELAQLALVRPLIFNTQEESTIRDYFKILTKKVSEDEITQEFKVNILVLTKVYMWFVFLLLDQRISVLFFSG